MIKINLGVIKLVRKDKDVNAHDILSNITLRKILKVLPMDMHRLHNV